MAKRFTDTEKWRDPWFRRLSPKHKTLWFYLCDKADNSGVWKKDYELASFEIGEPVNEEDIKFLNNGKKRIIIEKECLFITDFIEFQIGDLTQEKLTNLQKNCLKLVQKHKEKFSFFTGKLLVPYEYIDKGIVKGKGNGNGNIMKKEDFEPFWKLYPNKVSKKRALDKFLKLEKKVLPQLMAGLKQQITSEAWTKDEGKFIPHPTTWLNGERWEDEVNANGEEDINTITRKKYGLE